MSVLGVGPIYIQLFNNNSIIDIILYKNGIIKKLIYLKILF